MNIYYSIRDHIPSSRKGSSRAPPGSSRCLPLLVFGLLGVLLGVEGALFLDPAIVNEIEARAKRNVDVDKADEPDIRGDLQSCDCTRLRSERGNAQRQRLKSTEDDNTIPDAPLQCSSHAFVATKHPLLHSICMSTNFLVSPDHACFDTRPHDLYPN